MRPSKFAVILVIAVACFSCSSIASPLLDNGLDGVKIIRLVSDVMHQSAGAIANAQQASMRIFQSKGSPVHHKLEDPGNPCPGSITSKCTSPPSSELASCMLSFAEQITPDMIAGNIFGFPAILCQGTSRCADLILDYMSTCSCMDFRPLYNLVCPTAPTASQCSKNPDVQQFLALATNSSFGTYFSMMNFGEFMSSLSGQPDFSFCGDHNFYRNALLINSMGSCIYDIASSFPIPSYVTLPGNLNYKEFMTQSVKCALTMPSYVAQTYCSGNVAKCYSALKAPSSNLGACSTLSSTTCPSNCKSSLATFGSSSSTLPGSCCVSWFQGMAAAPACNPSAPRAITMSTLMGTECVAMLKLSLKMCDPQKSQCPDEQMINMYTNTAVLPAPCYAKSPASIAVAGCNVDTSLTATCPSSSASFMESSLFAPLKKTVATITFASDNLPKFYKQKYAETLSSVANAVQSQIGSGAIVVPISVALNSGQRRHLLQANSFIAKLSITSTAASGAAFDPKASIEAIQPNLLQTALTAQLQAQVTSNISASVSTKPTATADEKAQIPPALPSGETVRAPSTSSSPVLASVVFIQLLLLCITLFV